jgi:ketosteroid isomerase-like protein
MGGEGSGVHMTDSAEVVLESFRAVEQRDGELLMRLCDPDVEFRWPRSLPYGGTYQGVEGLARQAAAWTDTWDDLQTEAERQMEPRVLSAKDGEVIVLWHQRAVDHVGRRLDTPVLSLYQAHNGKLARAQMFYFDAAEVLRFLAAAGGRTLGV